VIHRTNVRSRPSIPNLDGSASFASLSKQPGDAQGSSDPSTPNSGSDSPVSQGTNPTSSDVLSRSPKILKLQPRSPGNRSWSFSLWNREVGATAPRLVPIREVPAVPSPSIITVEATATAKIFFETHFNSIFSGRDPRSQRLQELEDRLHGLPVSAEERQQVRKAWLGQESEYLRQSRVLKTRSNSIRHLESVSIAGYEVIKVLGKGSFGVVRLVKEKKEGHDVCDGAIEKDAAPRTKQNDTPSLKASTAGTRSPRRTDLTKMKKEVFAMKVIRKSDMVRNCQEGHLRAERDFLVASDKSQWIIALIASFQDTNYLYLVMDYMVGGDFLGLLIRKYVLSEDVTRWYVAEMILCVEEAHRLGWIHRDVKPDNFLISASGHLKISDFGLAFDGHWTHDQAYFNNQRHSLLQKLGITVEGDAEDRKEAKAADKQGRPLSAQVGLDGIQEPKAGEHLLEWRNHKERRRLAKSIVGTSQYMAPEVIRGELYDGRCDWWSIGIILYEVSFLSKEIKGNTSLTSCQCLYGFTPFACENRHDTKIRILVSILLTMIDVNS
jgi:serine/threonine protein kinase